MRNHYLDETWADSHDGLERKRMMEELRRVVKAID